MDAAIWQNINHSLSGFIRSKVPDEATAKDILQDTYLKMEMKLPQLKDQSKILPWAFQLTRNIINDYYRDRKKRLDSLPVIGEKMTDDVEPPTKHEYFSNCVPTFLDALPEKYREALYFVEIEGLSQKELAERLNISYSGAKSRVQRGREKLKEALLECCRISTDVYGNVIEYKRREKCGDDC